MFSARKAQILKERAALLQQIRTFFSDHNFLEVETPIRIPAPAPEAHIEPEPAGQWYLQASPELCMKQLLAAGCSHIFQICKCFRQHERGRLHLPEMTMLEWYRPGSYHELMTECEKLLHHLRPTGKLLYQGRTIDLRPPWPRIALADAFQKYAKVSLEKCMADNTFEETLVTLVEPHLGVDRPVFLTDYPRQYASLARLQPDHPELAQRFELYLAGIELANGFSELADAAEQRRRFEEEQSTIQALGRTPGPMPERFLQVLARMPESAGIALGVDRLVMLCTDAASLAAVVAFSPEDL